ncbi:TPA: helix-turn-helix domain-containing protein [Kluyvera ascorbata]|nr:helix-turn-helix domain-containing protein [Kluyvera ascorbata]
MPTQQISDFSVVVQDVRHQTHEEQPALALLWVLQGDVTLETSNGTRRLLDGALAIVNPNQRWSLASEQPNTLMTLTVAANWLTRMDAHFFGFDYQITAQPHASLTHEARLCSLMRQLLITHLTNHETHSRLEANRWLCEIAQLLATHFQQPRQSSTPHSEAAWSHRIRQVVARIESQYTQRLSLAEIARAERVSEAWLSRLFHKEVGVSFMQFITALRLEKSAELLLTTALPVQRIAQQQGFASARVMSDLFKRRHGMTPRQFRQQTTPQSRSRPREILPDRTLPVAAETLYALLNHTSTAAWDNPPPLQHHSQPRQIALNTLPARRVPLRRSEIIITLRELDDLLRDDVRQSLLALHVQIPIAGIDINEPFLSSRLFSDGWDDPQMVGYACWYNLQQVFTFLSRMGWRVLLHTSLTTRPDLLRQFLSLAAQHFPPSTLASWQFVWHWSPQASKEVWAQQKAAIRALSPDSLLGIWHRFTMAEDGIVDDAIITSPLLKEADFLACSANANERFQQQSFDGPRLSAAESYPVEKVRQIQRALRQHHLALPLWLLSWNTLTGSTRRTNGEFFRGALLMNNLLGLAEQVQLTGFWLNSSQQGEARSNGTFDTSSLALYYHHGLPRPIFWVLWLWHRLRGDVLVNDKNILLLHHHGRYQLLLRNPVVFNPWLSSEEAFIQRFRQQYPVALQPLHGKWKIKRHLFDQLNGALFPYLDAIDSSSGPDEETWTWLVHKTRPALSVREENVEENWQVVEALESNALVLYELTPLI